MASLSIAYTYPATYTLSINDYNGVLVQPSVLRAERSAAPKAIGRWYVHWKKGGGATDRI
jgi:hypothetical protein